MAEERFISTIKFSDGSVYNAYEGLMMIGKIYNISAEVMKEVRKIQLPNGETYTFRLEEPDTAALDKFFDEL